MVQLVDIRDVKVRDLEYQSPKVSKLGNQSVNVVYDSHKLSIQTPKCFLPFGVNKYESPYGTKYSIDLSLKGNSPIMTSFITMLQDLDEQNIIKAVENSETWFGRSMDKETIEKMYRPIVKINEGYPPIFRVKIINDTRGPLCTFFDSNKNTIDIDCVKPKNDVMCVIELTGMYFIAKEFGMTWKMVQLMNFPSQVLKDYAFIDDSDDDNDDAEPY